MKILALSDIHGEWDCFRPEEMPAADVVLCAGDLTENGVEGGEDELSAARDWLRKMGETYPAVFWIPGNHDIGITAKAFGSLPNVQCLLDRTVVVEQCPEFGRSPITIHGVSLCPVFDRPDLAAQFDYMTGDPAVEAAAYQFEAVDIVLSHCPPLGTLDFWPGDESHLPAHIGSPSLRCYLEHHAPALVICGHVHQDTGCARMGDTSVYNVAGCWEIIDL